MAFLRKRRLRFLLIAFLVLAGILFLLTLLPQPARMVADTVMRRAALNFGGEISVTSLEIGYFPPRVVAGGLKVRFPVPGGGEVRVTAERAALRIPYRALRGRFDRLDRLELNQPQVEWIRGETRGSADGGSGVGSSGRKAFTLRGLLVRDGTFRYSDPAAGLEIRLDGVDLDATGKRPGEMQGKVSPAKFQLTQGTRRVAGTVASAIRVEGQRVVLTDLDLQADTGVRGSGKLDFDRSGSAPTFHLEGTLAVPAGPAERPLFGALEGDATLDLHGNLEPEGMRLRGTVRIPRLSYDRLEATDIAARTTYRPGRLELSDVSARTLEGSVRGEAVLDWKAEEPGDALLSARVAATSLSIEALRRLAGQPALPFDGRVDHEGEYRLRGFRFDTLEGGGSLRASGMLRVGRPAEATINARIRVASSRVAIDDARLESPGLNAELSGEFPLAGGKAGRGRLTAQLADLSRLAPIIDTLPDAARRPVADIIGGSPGAVMKFQGALIWDRALAVEGRLFGGPLFLKGTGLGNLDADIRYEAPASFELRRLAMEGGEVALEAVGWARKRSPLKFALRGRMANMDLDWLKEWTGVDWPVKGKADMTVDLSGQVGELLGTVEWVSAQPVVYGIPLDRAEGKFVLEPGVVNVERFSIARGDGRLQMEGSVGLEGRPLRLTLSGQGLELGWLTEAGVVPTALEGAIGLRAEGTGTLAAPLVEGTVESAGVKVRGIDLGPISAQVHADAIGGTVDLVPQWGGTAFNGRVTWGPTLPVKGNLELKDLRIPAEAFDPDLARLGAAVTLRGNLEAEGELKNPGEIIAFGNLVRVGIDIGGQHLDAQVPAFIKWRRPRLELTPLRLAGGGTDVTLSGEGDPEGRTYRFQVEGSVALSALAPFWPGLTAAGSGTFLTILRGSPQGNEWEGWAEVKEGRLQGGGLPLPISGIKGRIVLDPDGGFRLDGVAGEAGGGRMTLDGGGRLKDFRPAALDIGLHGEEIQIRGPKGFQGRYDLDVRLIGDSVGGRLQGNVNLIRGVYSEDLKLESRLLSLAREGEEDVGDFSEPEDSYLSRVSLNLAVAADQGIWIKNDFATLEGRANLKIAGTLAEPEISGRISALEGGVIRFRRVEYRVQRGDIDLVDVDRFNPYFDISAQARISDYDVQLTLKGSLEHFEYELTSNPPLSQPDLVSLVVSGHTLQSIQAPGQSGRAAEDVAAGYLTQAFTGTLGGRLEGLTGLDQFTIDPVLLAGEANPASRITVGKQISENLFAAYSTLLGSTSEEIYQLEYKLTRDFKFTSVRDATGSVGGDFRYVWRRSTGGGAIPFVASLPKTIEQVAVEGEPGVKESRLRRRFPLDPGDPMDRMRESEGVDRLLDDYHKKDYLQATVDAREVPREGEPDRVDLVLEVHAGPRVEIQVQGTDSDRKWKKRLREHWIQSIFFEAEPEEARAYLEKRLREQGFADAKVTLEIREDGPERRGVSLTATPGPQVRVARVEFSGNQALETAQLEKVVRTRPGKKSFLNASQLPEDVTRIRARYAVDGYREARVAPPEVIRSPDPAEATVRFTIIEGEASRVGAVRIEGNRALSDEVLLAGNPVKPGAPYNRVKARLGKDAMRVDYDRAGYLDARIDFERDPQSGDLIYRIDEGTQHRVGNVTVRGTRLTRPEVVERELTFREGDPLSRVEMLKSQLALYRLGMFQSVEIRESGESEPGKARVEVQVAESPNLIQSVGVGYASDEGVRGLYEITNTNLHGRGRTLGFQARGSGIQTRVGAFLRDPFLFNRRLDSLLDTSWTHQENPSFTEETLQATLQVQRKFREHFRTLNRYTLKNVSLSHLQVSPEEAGVEDIRLGSLSSALVHDTRDNFYDPRRGVFEHLDFSVYARVLASQAQFLKFFGTSSMFHKVLKNSVWAQGIRLGLEDPMLRTEQIPISERFFAGGDTTIRGFDRDEVGPKDSDTGEPVGGQVLFIVNEEFRFPIWRFLRGVVFFDAGNVYEEFSDFDLLDTREVLGTGFHIETPIGPFRLEYGWKLDRRRGETPGRFHISIGHAF